MKIAVCVKQVPDTAKAPRITPDAVSIDASSVSFVVNPYDEYAIEEALRINTNQDDPVRIDDDSVTFGLDGIRPDP